MIPSACARVASTLAFALLLAGCTIDRRDSTGPTAYDFGPAPAYKRSNPALPGTVLIAPVRSPAWLDDAGIVYRLLYEDATRTHSYAMSKWSAEPGALVTDRLRSRFAALAQGVVAPGFNAGSDYTLRVELEDFSQHFDAPSQSRARVRARATLLDTAGRKFLAQRVFEIERPASPNATGAVKALTDATDAILEELAKWAVENARKPRSDEKK